MKRLWVVALSIVLGSIFCYYYSVRVNAAEGEFDNFTSWPPTAAMLREQVASVPKSGTASVPKSGTVGSVDDQRKKLLGEQLTARFRHHEPKIAVRVKFDHDSNHKDIIKLMCPARMEPWNMDWLAVNTWREVKADVGTAYNLDIYITYIGLSQIKVAELRPLPGQPDKVEIRYKSPAEIRRAMTGEVAADSSVTH